MEVTPGNEEEAAGPEQQPKSEPRFILDVHLGKLASYLRLLGFDTLYRNDYSDTELARTAQSEGRILLTRDGPLLRRRFVRSGYHPRSTNPEEQVREVVERFHLHGRARPWTRCLACNGDLRPVSKEDVLHLLEPRTRLYYDRFRQCTTCGRIYWEGTHFKALREKLVRFGFDNAGDAGGSVTEPPRP
jgi:uncharacterized protein with PIN domain